MLKLCANISWLFRELDFTDRIKAAGEAGFGAVEFHHPEGTDPGVIVESAHAAGVKIALFNAWPGDLLEGGPGLSGVPGREDEFRQAVAQAHAFGAAIGGGAVIQIGPSRVPEGVRREDCFEVFISNLREAATTLQGVNCKVMIEPMNVVDLPGVLIPDAAAALEAIDAADHENVGLQFDCYHEKMGGGDVFAFLEKSVGKISHLQFSDVPGRHEPGTGSLDIQRVFRVLEEKGYANWVAAEYMPTGSSGDSLAWLREYLGKAR